MNKKLYVKNYKGFKEQIIDFEDVNFLVGENSTGKTALMNLINVLSSESFLFNYQFNNRDVELGYFEEIISKNSTQKTFQIGTENIVMNNKKERVLRCLFQFKSVNSLPVVDFIKCSVDDLNFLIQVKPQSLDASYFIEHFDSFDRWIHKTSKSPKEPISTDMNRVMWPLPIVIQMLSNEIKDKIGTDYGTWNFDEGMFFDRFTWLAPIRAKAKRIYESYNIKFSPEGEHIPSLLKRLLTDPKKSKDAIVSLEKFGRESNLFDKIEVKELGDKNISPFEIIIRYNNIPVKLTNVGYGVSQILPLIVEMLTTKRNTFAIQQPEVHLHPRAQAAFGSFIFNSYKNQNNHFLIETHSDFTINRFRHELYKNQKKINLKSQVLFFERTKDGNIVTKIPLTTNGSYESNVPETYRDFFIDEELKLLEL